MARSLMRNDVHLGFLRCNCGVLCRSMMMLCRSGSLVQPGINPGSSRVGKMMCDEVISSVVTDENRDVEKPDVGLDIIREEIRVLLI